MYKYILLCLFTRYTIAIIIKYINIKYLPLLSLPTLIISFSFFRNYINYKQNDKGFFGGKVWWNNYRLIHAITFGIFSICALYKFKYSWTILLFDAILGTIFFSNKYL